MILAHTHGNHVLLNVFAKVNPGIQPSGANIHSTIVGGHIQDDLRYSRANWPTLGAVTDSIADGETPRRFAAAMACAFKTGSTDGLGSAAARSLPADDYEVVLHAWSAERAAAVADLAGNPLGVAIGDLESDADTKNIAEQVNAIGRMDAVIHNAGIQPRYPGGAQQRGALFESRAGARSQR